MYKLNEDNHIVPCRNGGHIENCGKFECNMMFKCPDFYCVVPGPMFVMASGIAL